MSQPTFLVTGATGKTGGAVARQLLEAGLPVRAVVRARDARSEGLERLGADIAVADLFDFEQLSAAMQGTTRAYFCPPFHPYMIQAAAAFAAAAREARLESIVAISQWLASPSHPALATRQHWLVDRLFAMMPDVTLTTVNPGFFADAPFLALVRYAALLGLFPLPADGAARCAPPSADDIARVAVAALLDPAAHSGKTYRPTGPTLLSVDEMVDVLSGVVGRTVRHVNVPLWMFYKAARLDGNDPFLLAVFRHYVREFESGTFALAGTTTDVRDVTGREAESFETVARRYAASPRARRTLGNTARALAEFALLPLMPGIDPLRYESESRMPLAPAPLYDMENARWLSEHVERHDRFLSRDVAAV